MSDLHIEMVEQVMHLIEPHLAEPMDIAEEYQMCADALERNNFHTLSAAWDILGFDRRMLNVR